MRHHDIWNNYTIPTPSTRVHFPRGLLNSSLPLAALPHVPGILEDCAVRKGLLIMIAVILFSARAVARTRDAVIWLRSIEQWPRSTTTTTTTTTTTVVPTNSSGNLRKSRASLADSSTLRMLGADITTAKTPQPDEKARLAYQRANSFRIPPCTHRHN